MARVGLIGVGDIPDTISSGFWGQWDGGEYLEERT